MKPLIVIGTYDHFGILADQVEALRWSEPDCEIVALVHDNPRLTAQAKAELRIEAFDLPRKYRVPEDSWRQLLDSWDVLEANGCKWQAWMGLDYDTLPIKRRAVGDLFGAVGDGAIAGRIVPAMRHLYFDEIQKLRPDPEASQRYLAGNCHFVTPGFRRAIREAAGDEHFVYQACAAGIPNDCLLAYIADQVGAPIIDTAAIEPDVYRRPPAEILADPELYWVHPIKSGHPLRPAAKELRSRPEFDVGPLVEAYLEATNG